ncbi:MAG: PBP1A family penicillin-binding protein [Bdellovibrionota bacterium]
MTKKKPSNTRKSRTSSKTKAKAKTKSTAKKKKSASKGRTRRKNKKTSLLKKLSLWKLFLIFIGVSGAIIGSTWLHVDHRVQKFLIRKGIAQRSAIYSDELRVFPSGELTLEKIKSILAKRSYKTSTSTKPPAGEYLISSNFVKLTTREYRTPAGTIRPPKTIEIFFGEDPEKPEVSFKSGDQQIDEFFFEPIMLSHFGDKDMRADHYLPLADIPKLLQAAVVLTEDQRFMQHYGIDFIGIGRAILANLKAGSVVQGGSTITQQLAKNLFFSSNRTLTRKYFEAFSALSLEQRISKAEILERYLNEVYLGQEGSIALHGVAEASKSFFRKEIKELSLSQMALLAAVIKAPSFYSPRSNPKRAKQRRNLVLKLMLDGGVINAQQYKTAVKSRLDVINQALHTKVAPHFLAALRRHITGSVNLDAVRSSGGTLFTSINSEIQRCAEVSVDNGLKELEEKFASLKRKPPLEAGLVAIEPYSGKVRAWVGSRDFSRNQFDHVDQGKRQVGSTIKPFLYLTALDPDINTSHPATPMTVLNDAPIQLNVNGEFWEPQNFDKQPRGRVTLRYALENSLNLSAVYTANMIGFDKVTQVARKFELSENVLAVPSLALGAIDTTLLRMTTAYSAIANGGILTTPRMFISVIDLDGSLLHSSTIQEKHVAPPAPTYVVTNLMQGVIERGTGNIIRRKGFKYPVAGKTGTSNDTRDSWFMGFTPELAVGTWVGFDDNAKVGLTGSSGAAPIWAEFMKCSAAFLRGLSFIPPRGIVFTKVDSLSGLRVSASCTGRGRAVDEVFVAGTEPASSCSRSSESELRSMPPIVEAGPGEYVDFSLEENPYNNPYLDTPRVSIDDIDE